ncbi:hypothetical protein DERP_010078 [Dermatophagoides pteronyssinus]|uniref:Nose resistant to fluoxetine protein 6-like n=1 Tax=Dermatophagoides pteronyssinus TaxID=6956 RepID=A0ABQ8JEZ1_DERPT|nr:hypothetical protein DERP_010078 [Dermatophagoides pteronyssinus]
MQTSNILIIKCCFCFRSKSFDQYSNGYLDPTIHQYQYQIAENFLFNHVQSLMIRNFEQFRSTINNNLNEMIDSSSGSFFGSGLLSGTFTNFGDFDSCLSIDNRQHLSNSTIDNDQDISTIEFIGKYCFATIRLPNQVKQFPSINFESSNSKLLSNNEIWKQSLLERWLQANPRYPLANALCLPSVCDEKFIGNLIQNAFKPLHETNFDIEFCQTKLDSSFDDWFKIKIILSVIMIIILALIILATILEIYQFQNETYKSMQIIHCFSLCSNFRSLFVIKNRMEYPWIDGWRVFLTLFVLLAHVSINQGVLQLLPISPFVHFPDDYQRQTTPIINRYLVNSTWTIKSFFMMSGFLLAQSFLKSKNLPSFGRYVLSRWLRFTPCYIGYIMFTIILGFIGNGPLFHEKIIESYLKPCINNLPYHLLYMNNWLDFRQMCGFQTWYLSVDFQLYIISFIVLSLYYYNFTRLAFIITSILILSSYLITMALFIFKLHGIPFFISVLYPQLPLGDRGYLLYWTATYNHFEAYFFGITIGVLVNKKITLNLSKVSIRKLFLLSLAILMIIPQIFPLFFFDYQQQRPLADLLSSYSWSNALIITISNLLWICSISFMFYLSSTYPIIINENIFIKTLSSHCFVPLARICFAIYLVHVPLTWFIVHQTRFPQLRNEFGTVSITITSIFTYRLYIILFFCIFECAYIRNICIIVTKRLIELKLRLSKLSSILCHIRGNGCGIRCNTGTLRIINARCFEPNNESVCGNFDL